GANLFAVGGIGNVVQVGQLRTDQLACLDEAVHARHGVVAFRDARTGVQPIDLLFLGEVDCDGRIDLDSGHALGALRDEREVPLLGALAVGYVHADRQPATTG